MNTFRYILGLIFVVTISGWTYLAASSRDARIHVYQIPKEAKAPPPSPQTRYPVTWQAPEHWQSKAPAGMRMASFTIVKKGREIADISIIALSDLAGDIPANVNRWRGQLSLGPIETGRSIPGMENIRIHGEDITLVDITSDEYLIDGKFKKRIIVAIIPKNEKIYFVKMTGEDTALGKEKSHLITFLEGLRFD